MLCCTIAAVSFGCELSNLSARLPNSAPTLPDTRKYSLHVHLHLITQNSTHTDCSHDSTHSSDKTDGQRAHATAQSLMS